MQKLKVVEEEDGKVKFELDRGRTLLVVVLGPTYIGRTARVVREDGRIAIEKYIDVVSEILSNLDKSNYLVLPKAQLHSDENPADNDIEVYEFYQ